jgi:hypothetical protein
MGNDLDEHVPDTWGPWNDTAHRPHAHQLVWLGDALSATLYYHAPSPAALLIEFIDFHDDIGRAHQFWQHPVWGSPEDDRSVVTGVGHRKDLGTIGGLPGDPPDALTL